MITEILHLIYLLWPITISSIIFFFVIGIFLAINIGSFIVGFILIIYYIYNYCKRKGLFTQVYSWFINKKENINTNLQTHIQKTFLVKGDLDKLPNGSALYIAHPHGLFSMAAFLHWAANVTQWPKEKKVKIAVHSIFFRIPIVCEIMESYGAIEATEEQIIKVLKTGESVALLTGGIRELHETHPGKMRLVLKKRSGFLRIARDLQIPIIPVLTFGENELFPPIQSAWFKYIHKYLIHWFHISIPIPTFSSIYNWFSLLYSPLVPSINTWIGNAIFPEEESFESLQKKVFDEFHRLYKEGRDNRYLEELEIL